MHGMRVEYPYAWNMDGICTEYVRKINVWQCIYPCISLHSHVYVRMSMHIRIYPRSVYVHVCVSIWSMRDAWIINGL